MLESKATGLEADSRDLTQMDKQTQAKLILAGVIDMSIALLLGLVMIEHFRSPPLAVERATGANQG